MFRITLDHINEQTEGEGDGQLARSEYATGWTPGVVLPHRFRLYDDDGILYFEGESDDDSSFEPLDWSKQTYGCTTIKYLNPDTGAWDAL